MKRGLSIIENQDFLALKAGAEILEEDAYGEKVLRLEERLYYDTWQTKASSTDARYMVDLSQRLRVWPHLRLHVQSASNFYQLAYSAVKDPARPPRRTYQAPGRNLWANSATAADTAQGRMSCLPRHMVTARAVKMAVKAKSIP